MEAKKFLAFGDCHCPFEDNEAVEWLLAQIREVKPGVIVCIGDLFEADSASRWPSEYSHTLADEFDAANKLLAKIRKTGGDAECVFLPGNHDANILSINRIDPKLRGLCDYRKAGNVPELEHWSQPAAYEYNRRGTYRIGQVVFSHGYESGAYAGKYESVVLTDQHGLYIHGHTHRPHEPKQCMLTSSVPLPFWYANTGTIRKMECEYMLRKRQQMWGSAVVVGETMPLKSPRTSRQWAAETRIHRMYGEMD